MKIFKIAASVMAIIGSIFLIYVVIMTYLGYKYGEPHSKWGS